MKRVAPNATLAVSQNVNLLHAVESRVVIYTKKGDRGKTGLYDAKRVGKDSLKIKVIGAVDEANSYLGIVLAESKGKTMSQAIHSIQKNLFAIGAILAGKKLVFSISKTKELEKQIDLIEGNLPPLSHFILPGGSKLAAHLHFSRSLARRAERMVVNLSRKEKVDPNILTFLNRLSDLLFILARKVNHDLGTEEVIWKGKNK